MVELGVGARMLSLERVHDSTGVGRGFHWSVRSRAGRFFPSARSRQSWIWIDAPPGG
jgi:hypothetical protein